MTSAPIVRWRGRAAAFGVAVAGIAAAIVALVQDPVRAWSHLLLDTYYLLSVSLAALLFLAIQFLSAARWSACLRRIPEALMATLPAAAVSMVSLTVARGPIAPSRHGDAIVSAAKAFYLSMPFMAARAVAVLGAWVWLAWLVRQACSAGRRRRLIHHRQMKRYAAIAAVVFAITFSIASVDWLMSLDARWSAPPLRRLSLRRAARARRRRVTLVARLLRARGPRAVHHGGPSPRSGRLLFGFQHVLGISVGQSVLLI